ncbi:unnamed protein product [Prunus brigantina]
MTVNVEITVGQIACSEGSQYRLFLAYHGPKLHGWAIDLVGPMPTALANKEMMIVATDYFTKWIEAKALSSTKEADVERFIWKNIICRFGCPQSIVTNNGTQFVGKQITTFLEKYGIKQHLSTPRFPQGNGQAEASNKIVLDCLKKRLEGA